MRYVQPAGRGFFPLDEELELLPGVLSPQGHECLVRLSGWMPFAKAAELLEDFMGMKISKIVSQNYTQAAGAAYVEMQTEEVAEFEKQMPRTEAGADRMQISADGAMVPLLHGVWAEVKTLVIGEVQPAQQVNGEQEVHTRNLSYFSRKVTAQEFQKLAWVEVQRRGVENAREIAAIMDGADWEQGFVDFHCPQAIRILDFAHAAGHINAIGEFLHGEHTPESRAWLDKQTHLLKHKGPEKILREIRKFHRKYPKAEIVSTNLAYLEKRKAQMQYPQFQAQGWPIGSGIVESGNKLVVETRLKGSGMHWAECHVNAMLALRNILCSGRWKQDWPKIEIRLRKQNRQRRNLLRQTHRPIPEEVITLPLAPKLEEAFVKILADKLDPVEAPPRSKKNPWRNFKHGKAQYQPSNSPKL